MRDQIENILNEKIRPSLALHSGNVKVISYTGGVLRVRLTGRCSGCPSATLTTEEFIKSEIMESLPEVKDVILVTGVSDELINTAKAILAGRGVA